MNPDIPKIIGVQHLDENEMYIIRTILGSCEVAVLNDMTEYPYPFSKYQLHELAKKLGATTVEEQVVDACPAIEPGTLAWADALAKIDQVARVNIIRVAKDFSHIK